MAKHQLRSSREAKKPKANKPKEKKGSAIAVSVLKKPEQISSDRRKI
jgi:hypothetical protein